MNRWWALGTTLIWLGGCGAKPPAAVSTATPTGSQETYRYCAGTVTEWEVPRCIRELTPEEQRRRSYSQRLVYRGEQLVRYETVTGSGALHKDEETRTYHYENGRVRSLTHSNWNGVVKGSGQMSPDGTRLFYLDHLGRPRPDFNPRDAWVGKTNGLILTLDQRGRVLAVAHTDHEGRPQPELGLYSVRVKRDDTGAILESAGFGKNGEPVSGGKLDVHRTVYVNDSHGAEVEERFFDPSGQPTVHEGAHCTRTRYDEVGEAVAYEYFDVADRPVRSNVYGAASVRWSRDERGNPTQLELFDERGQRTLGNNGFAIRKRVFDARDLVVEWANYGLQEEPIRDKSGDMIVQHRRDARGNVVEESSFDEQRKPALNVHGYHRVELDYDERDNPVAYRYLGIDGLPIKTGHASKRLQYDGDRLIGTTFFGANGQPINLPPGYASIEYRYGSDGGESARLYFDVNRKAVQLCPGTVGDALRTELRDRGSSARACYEALLRDRPTARGRLMLDLELSDRGAVVDSALSSDEIQDADFSECVLSVFKPAFRNAPAGGCARARVPFTFVPNAPETPTH